MSLLVLHLSDLHITDEKTGILNNSKQIAQSAFLPLRQASACLIIVTGDVAYSGAAEQFVLAEAFLDDIRQALKAEGCPVVDIVVVPGNHDCVLKPTDSVRSILIDRVVESPATAEDLDVVTKCTAAQQNFFDFRGRLTRASPCFDHPLWTEYELLVEGRLIRVSAINAAWMSRIPERPGQLVFPVNAFQDILSAPAQLRLALIHHPLNWYAQSTYHDLRKNLRRHCSAILSGHEHLAAAGQVADAEIGTNIYFEADSLNPHESSLVPGYSLMSFEFAKLEVEVNAFRWQSGRFQSMSPRTLSFAEATYGPIERSDLMRDFECILRDPGGVFAHPDKEEVKLDDVFVFPELIFLDRKDKDDTRYSVSSEELLFADPSGHRLLLVGEDKAGKTALLYRAFLEYHALGYWPLYVPGSRISLRSGEDISKILSKVAGEQYRDTRCFGSAQKLKKIALVDDIDRLKSGPRSLGRLVQGLENHFGSIVLTASQGFEIRELVSEDAAITLSGFQTLEFMRFGHALRHRMITRWCQLASWSSLADLDREIHAAEHLINSVLGKNLAPSLPIYLLVLLQSYSQQQQGELQNSSFARYFEYLIIRSLVKAGVRPDSYDELFNYLSQLAWYFRETEIDEATHAELLGFNRVFSERFTTVDLGSRLELLVATRLLIKRGDSYEFAYPYIYYFFLGRWLVRNLDAPGIKEKVESWCEKLYLRKNSSALIFLSYHSNSGWIIETISAVLDRCFPKNVCLNLNTDIDAINGLVDATARVLLREPDVPENQENARRLRDKIDQIEDRDGLDEADDGDSEIIGEKDATKDQLEQIGNLNLLLKTAEILGQIVKNYYGSLERETKEELLRKVIEGPLRFLRSLIDQITEDPSAFVSEMEKIIAVQHPECDPLERKDVAKRVAFQLVGMVTTGFFLRVASWIASKRIEEDIHNVVEENNTFAFRLMEAASKLVLPREIAHDEVRRLARDLRGNGFAFKVLQGMGVRHLHLFYVPRRDKQRLCQTLNIEFCSSGFIDLKTKDNKLLKRSD